MKTTKQELEKRKEEILNDLKNSVQIGGDNLKWIVECIDTMISDKQKCPKCSEHLVLQWNGVKCNKCAYHFSY